MYYFAFGSNMNADRLRERGVRFGVRCGGVLQGWTLTFNKAAAQGGGVGYATIEEDPGAEVEGILYEVDHRGIMALDGYEGVPYHYERRTVFVVRCDGQVVPAIVYIAASRQMREGLRPTAEYLAHLLAGAPFLSADYVAALEATPTALVRQFANVWGGSGRPRSARVGRTAQPAMTGWLAQPASRRAWDDEEELVDPNALINPEDLIDPDALPVDQVEVLAAERVASSGASQDSFWSLYRQIDDDETRM